MDKTEFPQFLALLDDVYALHGKTLNDGAKAIFVRAAAAYSLDTLRAALSSHVQDPERGQYPPKPADLIAHIRGASLDDGRPGADEAWAIALQSRDERMTVVWTTEAFDAFQIARPVLDAGDDIGARLAFRDAYNRLVAAARRTRRQVVWQPSLGWDAEIREKVLRAAVVSHQLTSPMVAALLPAPDENASFDEDKARANLQRIRELVANIPSSLERTAAARAARAQRERDLIEARREDLRAQAEGLGLTDEGYEQLRNK